MANPGIKVVHILSTAYSGSTWVNLLFGSHSEAFSVGELKMANRAGYDKCAIHGVACPILSKFDPESSENPFLQLQRLSGKNVLIVNNSRKFLSAQEHPQINSQFIHLIRDGRAVTASFLRKGRQPNMWCASRRWVHEIRRDRRLLRRLRHYPTCTLHYETVVVEPFEQLQRLCHMIGLEAVEGMVRYWEHEHHFFGGNRGTLLAMLKQRDASLELAAPPLSSATGKRENLAYYMETDPMRFEDKRWKRELSDRQLRTFQFIAGRVNRAMGYSPATDRNSCRTAISREGNRA